MSHEQPVELTYEPPAVTDLGSLAELTEAANSGPLNDGVFTHLTS